MLISHEAMTTFIVEYMYSELKFLNAIRIIGWVAIIYYVCDPTLGPCISGPRPLDVPALTFSDGPIERFLLYSVLWQVHLVEAFPISHLVDVQSTSKLQLMQ